MSDIFGAILSMDMGFPPDLSEEAVDLITRLLHEDPAARLGANGSADVRLHPFFAGTNWGEMMQEKPPFVPDLEGDADVSNFAEQRPVEDDWESILDQDRRRAAAAAGPSDQLYRLTHLDSLSSSSQDAIASELADTGFDYSHF